MEHIGRALGNTFGSTTAIRKVANEYHQKALKYQKQGNETKAEEHYHQALAMGQEAQQFNPKKSKVYRTLAAISLDYAGLLERQHRTTEAKELYQQAQAYADEAHKLEPQHPKVQGLFRAVNAQCSQFLRAQGQTAQADQALEKMVQSLQIQQNPVSNRSDVAEYFSSSSGWVPSRHNPTQGSSFYPNPAFDTHFSSLPPCAKPFFTQPLQANTQSTYVLPQPGEPIQNTHYLVWCLRQNTASQEDTDIWMEEAKGVIERFSQMKVKGLAHVQEVVAFTALDHPQLHRSLTNALLKGLEDNRLLNLALLQGLSVMVLHRAHLTEDRHSIGDYIQVLQALLGLLERTHIDQNPEHAQTVLHTLSLLLDQMVYLQVKEIDRIKIEGPLKTALSRFADDKKYPKLEWPIQYIQQALARLPNNETFSEALIRRVLPMLGGVSYLTTFGLKIASAEIFILGFEPDKLWDAYECFKDVFAIGHSRCAPWYGELRFIDVLMGLGKLELVEKLLERNAGQRDVSFLCGLCDRLERIASIQHDARARDGALRLLKGIKEGQIEWAPQESIQSYASQSLDRVALIWPTPNAEAMERIGYAPPAWHPFWQAVPRSVILKAIQEKAQRHVETRALPSQIQKIHTSVGELKTAYLDRFKEQQALELRSKKEPLAILGQNIEAEYFTAWEEPGEIQDGLAMYVAPQATTVTDKKTFFDLDEAVTAFLTQANDASQKTQVLLLRGEAGLGKSTFNRHLARRLWQDYSAASGERPIPLYISLPTIDGPNKNLIGQYLSDKCDFSPEQINALRASQRFILILDGYDEIPADQRNLYADEKLNQWQAKILLSCRPEYLTEGYQNHLQPRGRSRVLLEYQLAPFSEQSIETYIHQYVEHTQTQWSAQDYQDSLAQIPNVKELLGTPFLLKMALSVLPTLEEIQPGQGALTRIKLYEQFVQTWFERSLARLDAIQSKLTETQKNAFYGLKDEGFIEHSQIFNTDFALALSEAKTTVAAYSPIARLGRAQDKRYETFLSNKDEEKNLLRFSALLTRQQQQYRFIHKSIQDYLVARAVWEALETSAGLEASRMGEPLNGQENVHQLWEALNDSDQVDQEGLLNRFNLVEDTAILRFLVERMQQDRGLVRPMLGWLKASTQTAAVSQGAANAITLLVGAGFPLNGMDLKGIRIPGADLSFGMLDSVQLQGADLSGVKFRASWLPQANLSGAQMAGVQFGEWAYLQEESQVSSCAYSPDGQTCAIGLYNGTIRVYATSNWEKMHTLTGHTDSVSSVVYSPSGAQIASGSDDTTVRLWDAHSGAAGRTLTGHTGWVMSVVYSPSGAQIASGSLDTTVRLWEVVSGQCLSVIQAWSGVYSVAWTGLNGQDYLVSGSKDGSVRQWEIKKNPEKGYKAILCWSMPRHEELMVEDTLIEEAHGLSPMNVRLLTQRGAIGGSLSLRG